MRCSATPPPKWIQNMYAWRTLCAEMSGVRYVREWSTCKGERCGKVKHEQINNKQKTPHAGSRSSRDGKPLAAIGTCHGPYMSERWSRRAMVRHAGSPSSTGTVHLRHRVAEGTRTQVPTTEVSSGGLGGVESGTIDRREEGASPLAKSFVGGSEGPYFHHPSGPIPMGASELGRPPLHPPPPLEN